MWMKLSGEKRQCWAVHRQNNEKGELSSGMDFFFPPASRS